MDLFEKYMHIWIIVRAAHEMNVDISKDLAPLKTYTGHNKYILDLKEYCEERGMIQTVERMGAEHLPYKNCSIDIY